MNILVAVKRWLYDKKVIIPKAIVDRGIYYCPLCLSDIEVASGDRATTCPTCKTRVYVN